VGGARAAPGGSGGGPCSSLGQRVRYGGSWGRCGTFTAYVASRFFEQGEEQQESTSEAVLERLEALSAEVQALRREWLRDVSSRSGTYLFGAQPCVCELPPAAPPKTLR
ncbi:MAG: hypothetical protein M3511_16380, partial [Deinococcota bacterium]|nr:hypothetical protein [Deinococcota bacterium]